MTSTNEINWGSTLLIVLFCVLGALGGGMSVQLGLHKLPGGMLVAFGFGAGIFIAICAIILNQVLSHFKEEN